MQTKYRFDTIANKIEFFSTMLENVEKWEHNEDLFLCIVAEYHLTANIEAGAEYCRWIRRELIEDGKLNPDTPHPNHLQQFQNITE